MPPSIFTFMDSSSFPPVPLNALVRLFFDASGGIGSYSYQMLPGGLTGSLIHSQGKLYVWDRDDPSTNPYGQSIAIVGELGLERVVHLDNPFGIGASSINLAIDTTADRNFWLLDNFGDGNLYSYSTVGGAFRFQIVHPPAFSSFAGLKAVRLNGVDYVVTMGFPVDQSVQVCFINASTGAIDHQVGVPMPGGLYTIRTVTLDITSDNATCVFINISWQGSFTTDPCDSFLVKVTPGGLVTYNLYFHQVIGGGSLLAPIAMFGDATNSRVAIWFTNASGNVDIIYVSFSGSVLFTISGIIPDNNVSPSFVPTLSAGFLRAQSYEIDASNDTFLVSGPIVSPYRKIRRLTAGGTLVSDTNMPYQWVNGNTTTGFAGIGGVYNWAYAPVSLIVSNRQPRIFISS